MLKLINRMYCLINNTKFNGLNLKRVLFFSLLFILPFAHSKEQTLEVYNKWRISLPSPYEVEPLLLPRGTAFNIVYKNKKHILIIKKTENITEASLEKKLKELSGIPRTKIIKKYGKKRLFSFQTKEGVFYFSSEGGHLYLTDKNPEIVVSLFTPPKASREKK